WSSLSDRNAKENFRAVDAKRVLEGLAAMPISSWNYKTQDKTIRHIGPMAQDFAAAFEIGEDEKHIATVDAAGVAFAAIQGLNQKLEEALKDKEAQLKAQGADLEALREELSQLRAHLDATAKP